MGCDIIAYLEYFDGELWQIAGDELDFPRSYAMFAVFAGVRNNDNITPISLPRGIPKDVSQAILDKEPYEGHSESWLLLKELTDFDWMQYDLKEMFLSHYLHAIAQNVKFIPPYIWNDKIRIVFWFNS